jgi:hypothetical protein
MAACDNLSTTSALRTLFKPQTMPAGVCESLRPKACRKLTANKTPSHHHTQYNQRQLEDTHLRPWARA